MAAQLFSSVTELKKYIPVSASFALSDIESFITEAARDKIIPWVGSTIYNALVTAHAANSMNPTQTALLPYIQLPLICFAFDKYLPWSKVQVGSAGIMRAETQEHKSAFKYQEKDLQDSNRTRAWDALEDLLIYMEANRVALSWTNTDGYYESGSLVINTSKEFNKQFRTGQGRQLFETLRGIILDVEEMALIPNIGQEYYDELKAVIMVRATPSSEDAAALRLIKKAIAHYTIDQALQQKLVYATAQGVFTYEDSLPEALDARKPAALDAVSATQRQAKDFAERYLPKLMNLLRDNPDDYPTFTAWEAEKTKGLTIDAKRIEANRISNNIAQEGGTFFV